MNMAQETPSAENDRWVAHRHKSWQTHDETWQEEAEHLRQVVQMLERDIVILLDQVNKNKKGERK